MPTKTPSDEARPIMPLALHMARLPFDRGITRSPMTPEVSRELAKEATPLSSSGPYSPFLAVEQCT